MRVVIVDTASKRERDVPRLRFADIPSRLLVPGLFLLLGFGVLAFGGVYEWSRFVFQIWAGTLLLIWVGQQILSGRVTLSKNPLYLPALLFFVLILAQILVNISAYRYVSEYEALRYVSYGIVLLIAAECVRGETVRKKTIAWLIAFGTIYAFFALAQESAPNGKIYWMWTPRYPGGIYGSYVNHNHYAGLMEMLVPVPLVVSFGHLLQGGKRVIVVFCAVLMASTIFLSRSRGGMISFIVEIVFLASLVLVQRKNLRASAGLLAVCFSVVGLLIFIGKAQVLGRLGDLDPGARLNMTTDSLKMFLHRPVLGWGLGTFPTVYPSYRSFYTNLFVNQAHNDYAQLLVEMGLLGFALMVWFLISLYQKGFPKSRRWEFSWDAALSLAALLGCTGILFHSFVDYNLQIPANAACFYALAALASSDLTVSVRSRRSRSSETEVVKQF